MEGVALSSRAHEPNREQLTSRAMLTNRETADMMPQAKPEFTFAFKNSGKLAGKVGVGASGGATGSTIKSTSLLGKVSEEEGETSSTGCAPSAVSAAARLPAAGRLPPKQTMGDTTYRSLVMITSDPSQVKAVTQRGEKPRAKPAISLSSGFVFSFTVDFPRQKVFQELMNVAQPLGLDLGPYEQSLAMSKEDSTAAKVLKQGVVRKIVDRAKGTTTLQELTQLEKDKKLEWTQLSSSDTDLRMMGREPTRLPWTSISLSDAPAGTMVTFEFSFDSVLIASEELRRWGLGGCLCFGASKLDNMPLTIRRKLPAAMRTSWQEDMGGRGHAATHTPAALGGFEIAFGMPFYRKDLWKELTKVQYPLGSNPTADFQLYGEGGKELAKDDQVGVGTKRIVFFKDPQDAGQVISEVSNLFETKDACFMKWRQILSSKGGLQMLGLGERKPEFSFGIIDGTPEGGEGSTLFLSYDFHAVSFNHGGGSPFQKGGFMYEGAVAAEYVRGVLEPNIKDAFEDDMLMRGYKKLD